MIMHAYNAFSSKNYGNISTLVLQICSKGQISPSTFKKINLVPQLMFLGQICPYTYVVLHNTMWLMLSLPLAISSPSQSACLVVVQQVIKYVHDIIMWSRLD